jgi:hypothetical protein
VKRTADFIQPEPQPKQTESLPSARA